MQENCNHDYSYFGKAINFDCDYFAIKPTEYNYSTIVENSTQLQLLSMNIPSLQGLDDDPLQQELNQLPNAYLL